MRRTLIASIVIVALCSFVHAQDIRENRSEMGRTPAGTGTADRETPRITGENIYFNKCNGCHPCGGNVINPSLPLKKAAQFDTPKHFIEFLRNPGKPKGQVGMPSFNSASISDEQAQMLYDYITKKLIGPRGQLSTDDLLRKPEDMPKKPDRFR